VLGHCGSAIINMISEDTAIAAANLERDVWDELPQLLKALPEEAG